MVRVGTETARSGTARPHPILKGIALKAGLRTALNPVVRVASFTVSEFRARLRFDQKFILKFEFMAKYSCEWFFRKGIHYNKIR
jgi:hypothetical protein